MQLSTSKHVEILDITDKVSGAVRSSNIDEGMCAISTSHTTCAIIVNEHESGLVSDIIELLEKLVPSSAGYYHDRIDNNADAHLRAVLLGNSETMPVRKGNLELGTWQSIFFVELDGPRKRNVDIVVSSSDFRG
ncbi:YjbQ family protein [Methanohalophilus sp. RSK]|uniref:secondary thiamine-phosphate synthase enzyme YjbQ n=1 Tax=Methanohalophilus sp. RSK TaxID=2485783 RepID=UPI000F43AC4D|nr:secondary thiamine-phosphate synthase enzyme YjbQ [Methanohalophilus sp. RSK]RNI12940.1 YjbQ family protein [Methanohalophilus sp. RSK]